MSETREFLLRTENLLAQVEAIRAQLEELRTDLLGSGFESSFSSSEPGIPERSAPELERVRLYEASPAVQNGHERRVAPRHVAAQILVTLSGLDSSEEPQPGWVVDYSPFGIGIIVEEDIPVDRVLQIRPFQASDEAPWVDLIVRNSRTDQHGLRLGCQFRTEVTWNDLRWLGLS